LSLFRGCPFWERHDLYGIVAKIRRRVKFSEAVFLLFFFNFTAQQPFFYSYLVLRFMSWHYIEKEYYDYADDIEGVNIHYVWTPLGSEADWENQRITRFLPRVQPSPLEPLEALSSSTEEEGPPLPRLRKKILKLPLHILDPATNVVSDKYLLHHYFEVFQDGHRHYSPLYTEEINTSAEINSPAPSASNQERSSPSFPITAADVKESK
jgi:hypothetical protein